MHTQALTVRFPWSANPDATETIEIEAPSLVALADLRREFTGGRSYCVAPADRWGIYPAHRRAVLVSATEPVREA
jgi:hypothetical protein